MDDYTAEIISAQGSPSPGTNRKTPSGTSQDTNPDTPNTPRSGLRGGFSMLRDRAGLQDKLMEKLLQQVIPTDDNPNAFSGDYGHQHDKPAFSLATMSYNFRRFNARIGVVFQFQDKAIGLFSWETPSHTLSFLSVFTFVCLDPNLIFALPIFIALLAIFIPSFLARHPAPPKGTLSSDQNIGYSASGPPIAPAATVHPVKELSKDFFRNMAHLQNSMGDFSLAHDKIVELLVPVTNFSDEALSSAIFLFLFIGGIIMTITAHIVPWRFVFLAGGWLAICSAHPGVARIIESIHKDHFGTMQEEKAKTWLDNWIATDVILDSAPETREVEVFELQKKTLGREWEPWLFSPSPFDPLSQAKLSGERPRGTRFFEDVMAPDGWEWSEKKWALDLWSREWVEERIITGVEVETEGERWVYDIYEEPEEHIGVVDTPVKGKQHAIPQPSWEEGEDGSGRRGEWRRRRWVRLVKRRVTLEM